jgi:CubicO group peptidase (beta-lactamase class C family)
VDPLLAVDQWPVGHVAVGVVRAGEVLATRGPVDRPFPLASVTKLLTAMAVLVAVEEGIVALDDPVDLGTPPSPGGPEGATVAHLLAHASGLGFDGARLAAPGRRRIYSNAGFELLGHLVAERSGMPFATYAREAVFAPLGMAATAISGSPAWQASGSVADLCAFGRELLAATLVSEKTLATATTVAFPGLTGIMPGFGRQEPNDWGLGFELRAHKTPHWTGTSNSPATFGHFGRTGTFLWVDPDAGGTSRTPDASGTPRTPDASGTPRTPDASGTPRTPGAGLALACLTDRDFGPWAAAAWPALSDAVLATWA